MSRITLVLLALCAVAIYSVEAEKRKMNCGKKPPSGADWTAVPQGKACSGSKWNKKGERCCCKCGENTKKGGGRGWYCNNDKFKFCPGSPDEKCGPPPADADFRKCADDQECKGQLRIDGKMCCSKCDKEVGSPGRGYYCAAKYCPGQSGATTASSSDTTTSATNSGSSTTSAAGSTSSAAGTTSAAGSTTGAAGTTSAAGSTTAAAGTSDTTSSAGGSST